MGCFAAVKIALAFSMPTSIVGRRMEHQQRLAQDREAIRQLLLGDVVEKFLADAERPAGERHLDLALSRDLATCSLNRPATCAGSDGAAMVATARASGMRCAAASTAAPPRLWPIRIAGARERLAQMIGGGDQIVDVRGEMSCWRTRLRWRRAR